MGAKCYTLQGEEFSEHTLSGRTLGSRFVCARCLAYDEEAADEAFARIEALRDEWAALGYGASVYESAGELAQMLTDALAPPSRTPVQADEAAKGASE